MAADDRIVRVRRERVSDQLDVGDPIGREVGASRQRAQDSWKHRLRHRARSKAHLDGGGELGLRAVGACLVTRLRERLQAAGCKSLNIAIVAPQLPENSGAFLNDFTKSVSESTLRTVSL